MYVSDLQKKDLDNEGNGGKNSGHGWALMGALCGAASFCFVLAAIYSLGSEGEMGMVWAIPVGMFGLAFSATAKDGGYDGNSYTIGMVLSLMGIGFAAVLLLLASRFQNTLRVLSELQKLQSIFN